MSKKLRTDDLPLILNGKYFSVKTKDEDGNVTGQCLTCNKDIKGSTKATSNFITHLQLKHAEIYEEYKKYKAKSFEDKKQSKLNYPVLARVSGEQEKVENRIIDYIISTMTPLSHVENQCFIKLATGGNSALKIFTRKTCRNRIRSRYLESKQKLSKSLESISSVCVTSDIWSTNHRGFLGVTCHWIAEDFSRKSAALALRRFKGSHTGDKIMEILVDIFSAYQIQDKISKAITDNGTNFVKAFQEYGLKSCDLKEELGIEEEEIVSVELSKEIMDDCLPKHYRCASHTLSLIATSDLEKELEKIVPKQDKKLLRSTFAKCTAYWNKSARSIQVAEDIKEKTSTAVKTPVATRWNSLFDSIEHLLKHENLDELFQTANVATLKISEKEFLQGYYESLKPIAWALDKLQGDKNMFFGFIAPVLMKAKGKLESIASQETNSKHYVAKALLNGLQKRYDYLLNLSLTCAHDEIISAISLPCFKLWWVPENRREEIKAVFINTVKKIANEMPELKAKPTEKVMQNNDDLFDFEGMNDTGIEDVELECTKYFSDKSIELKELDNYPCIKAVFLKYNTALPSSAPAERMFSYGKLIFRAQRANMTDDLFEEILFLKMNCADVF